MDLPSFISKKNLKWHWVYRGAKGNPMALVVRYDEAGQKKRFHQYHLDENSGWIEGASTPSPLFGLDSLPEEHDSSIVYIFEGEKCVTAAHSLDLAALTSMRGSSQAHLADWAILAGYRHIRQFVLIPDNDEAGKKYMESVSEELKKVCPYSEVVVCPLPVTEKGEDFIDWLQKQSNCPLDWDGFSPIDEPGSLFLKNSFEKLVAENSKLYKEYFQMADSVPVIFDKEPEPIVEVLSHVLPCPIQALPEPIVDWMQGLADQMQIPVDFFAVPFLVTIGSIIGRKRALSLRPNTGWFEFPNLWGMLIGRPSVMKSPAMEAVNNPLKKLADQAREKHEVDLKKFKTDSKSWEFREKANGEVYKKKYKESLESRKSGEMLPEEFKDEDPPVESKKKRYKSDDPTVEKLGEILIENTQGILLFRDEISGWLYSFEKAGRENDRQFFLESWSGKKDFDVDRIARGSLHIPALFLSIFGSIQPGPLSQYIRSTIKGGVGDDGFLQRFSLMIWPDVGPDWVRRLIWKRILENIRRFYRLYVLFLSILNHQ
ncbi:MAG: DUF3987 domain-containing protein [Chlamydiota bacterium]